MRRPVEQRCRGAGAEPETIHALERHALIGSSFAELDAEFAPDMFRQRIAAHRLTGLRTAELQHMPARRAVAEIVIEARHTVHLRTREVERLRAQPDRVLVQIAKRLVQRRKYGKEAAT